MEEVTEVPFDDVAPSYPPSHDTAAWLAAFRRAHFFSDLPFLLISIACVGTWFLTKLTGRGTAALLRKCRRRGRDRPRETV